MVLVYSGLKNDENGGMTHFGQMVKDGWVFGLIPDSEDCTGWDSGQMQNLYDKICNEWEKYANLPSLLPEELRNRHAKIYQDAIKHACMGILDLVEKNTFTMGVSKFFSVCSITTARRVDFNFTSVPEG